MVKDGYKQSDVGLIPKDWEVKEIGDICHIFGRIGFRGYTVNDIVTEDKGVITISPSNIVNNTTNFDKCTYISWFKYEESPEIKIFNGDILIVKTGSTVGKTAIVNNLRREATINPQIVVLKKIKIDNFYLGYLAGYKDFQNNISRTIVGGAIPTLSQKQIASYKIPIPPKEEQKAIAKALSDTDELISSLEKLISKKEAIKQGTMQQLLTGKKRLSGFSGEWEEKSIKDLVSTPVTDGPHETPKFLEQGIPFLSVNNLVNNKIDLTDLRYISKDYDLICSRKCKPQKFDILLGKAASVGKVAIVKDDIDFNIWSPIALIRIREDKLPLFFYYAFQTKYILSQIELLTNSSSQGNIGIGDIEKLKFKFPFDIKEQQAIAQILSDMDNEIESLKSKLSKTKAIKDGMMSELLTGKTRLKVKDE